LTIFPLNELRVRCNGIKVSSGTQRIHLPILLISRRRNSRIGGRYRKDSGNRNLYRQG
jgi:hypothetical protein